MLKNQKCKHQKMYSKFVKKIIAQNIYYHASTTQNSNLVI